MTCRVHALAIDAIDPSRLARFWAALLSWDQAENASGCVLLPTDDTGFQLHFQPTQRRNVTPNRMHFHLTSTSLGDQQHTVERALALGASHLDVGQRADEGHVVLADPEGNELCVIEPGNRFLEGCGFLAELSCDGSQEVGYFWSRALGWPLVWDQDQETAIRSPHGGPKISWGGPPVAPKTGENRMRLELVCEPGREEAEVERLTSLGATRLHGGEREVSGVMLADPDGNEFRVLTRL